MLLLRPFKGFVSFFKALFQGFLSFFCLRLFLLRDSCPFCLVIYYIIRDSDPFNKAVLRDCVFLCSKVFVKGNK